MRRVIGTNLKKSMSDWKTRSDWKVDNKGSYWKFICPLTLREIKMTKKKNGEGSFMRHFVK